MTLTLDTPAGVERGKRERLAVGLYDAQALSQGQAAEVAGMSRAEFLDALGHANVAPWHFSAEEALAEARHGLEPGSAPACL